MQLAGGLESLSSFIEMLPQPCPSSGFQSPQPPAPWVTLETALGDWWPEGEWWAGKAMGREQVA